MLAQILENKLAEVAARAGHRPLAELRGLARDLPPCRPWEAALNHLGQVEIIAEIKKASPSRGSLRADLDVPAQARAYARGGAAAISVITDYKFFQGDLKFITLVRQQVSLPLLQKDFLVDAYQLYEGRAAGADAVLLIAAALEDGKLADFLGLAGELGLGHLVEVHTPAEVEWAVKAGARVIGINNRDLRTMQVDTGTTAALRGLCGPQQVVVSESGIKSPADMEGLARLQVHAALVGEALVTSPDPGGMVAELRRHGRWPADGAG